MTLWHTDAAFARRTIATVRAEIARYERIFSLYEPESEISRLNAAGTLNRPAPELRALIEEGQRFGSLTAGAFDISVQPLWRLYEAHFWSHTNVVEDIIARAQEWRGNWSTSDASIRAPAASRSPANIWRSRSTASRKALSPT